MLQQATALGVKRFVLFASARVEKSYWQSTGLEPAALREQLLLGLEQAGRHGAARDRVRAPLPSLRRGRAAATRARRAHPRRASRRASRALEAHATCATVLVIGPEGGLQDHELERLDAVGAQRVGLGPRVLRVETAVVALLARLAG